MKKILFTLLIKNIITLSFSALPLTTDDAGIVEIKKLELETSLEITPEQTILPISIKTGITKNFDIGILINYTITPSENMGLNKNPLLSLKFSPIEEFISISFNNELSKSNYFLNLIFSKNIKYVILHFNYGVVYYEEYQNIFSFATEYKIKNFDFVNDFIFEQNNYEKYLLGVRYYIKDENFITLGIENIFNSLSKKFLFGLHNKF